jgi:tetratricopeptide (TPR) repeat protein
MAREAVARAMVLDDTLADAHCIDAQIRMAWEFDWVGSEQAFKRALALRPGHADTYDLDGRLCSALGRFDESLALVRRAQELDPLAHRSDGANALLRAGRFEEAAVAASRVVEVDPHYDRGHATLGWALIKVGRMEEGLASLRRAVALSPADLQWQAQLGQALAMAGQPDRAREILGRLQAQAAERYVSPYHLAYIYTGLGEFESAMDHLEQAQTLRSGAIYGIKGSFLFTPLHGHPRFEALLRSMNLA